MKTMQNKIGYNLRLKMAMTLLFGLFMTFSCDNDFLSEGNPSAASVENSFNTIAEAEKAVFGIYSGFQANQMYGRDFWWIPDMLSDETQTGGPQIDDPREAILDYNIDASNGTNSNVWRAIYRIIHRANFVITVLPEKENLELTAASINLLVGEAKFLRAWCYFQLVTYWGTVPFTLAPVENTDGIPMVESEEALFSVILEDLMAAEAALPNVTAYRGTANIGRATKGAAQALMGKVELYRSNYTAARTAFQKVIDSGEYDLAPNYEDNHREENENNIESLFEIQFGRYESGNQGWSDTGSGGKIEQMRGGDYSPLVWHNTLPSDILKAAFEDGDPRYKLCFIEYGDTFGPDNTVFDATKVAQGITEIETHWKKYTRLYKGADLWSGINIRVIRYADVLLMMAEIENEQNGPTGTALTYLNRIRDRVGMPNYPTAEYPVSTKEEMFNAIVHEKQIELCSEQIRARDVKRWFREGKIGQPHPNYLDKHKYMPVPIDEIDNNAALDGSNQKPGY